VRGEFAVRTPMKNVKFSEEDQGENLKDALEGGVLKKLGKKTLEWAWGGRGMRGSRRESKGLKKVWERRGKGSKKFCV